MRKEIICYVLAASCFSFSVEQSLFGYIEETPEIIRDSATVAKDWEHAENVLRNGVKQLVKSAMPFLMEGAQSLNISSTCVRDTLHLVGGLQKLQTWAMRFLDSSGKFPDGMITGTIHNYGDYDECIDTVVFNARSGRHKREVMYTGKYCLLSLKMHLPPKKPHIKSGEVMGELRGIYERGSVLGSVALYAPLMYFSGMRSGVCLPSGCSTDDINQLTGKVADYMKIYIRALECQVKEEPMYTPMMIFVMSAYSFVGFIVLMATLTDIYILYCKTEQYKASHRLIRVVLAFSFISNFKKLVDTSTSSETLSCLNGIRFLTMSWVTLFHSVAFQLGYSTGGLLHVIESGKNDFALQVIANPTESLDTFFCMGGFLVCYIATKNVIIAKRNFSIMLYIFHRLWRLLPVMFFTMLFVFLLELICSGPVAKEILKPIVRGCTENAWTLPLFINNIYQPNNACIPHTWYLSADTQMYIGCLIILLPLFRWPKLGISIAVGIIVGSLIACGIVTYVNNYPPAPVMGNFNIGEAGKYVTDYVFKPYPHIPPYVTGMLGGYFLAMKPKFKISKVFQILGWSCAIICAVSVVYGVFDWQKGKEPTLVETISYAVFHKLGWGLSIMWMIICCATGHGGIVNYILSWKLWIPVGRLTYCAYLVHVLVIMCFLAMTRGVYSWKYIFSVYIFFGHLMVTYGVAFVASMLVESPFIALEKLFLRPDEGEKGQKNVKNKNHASGIPEIIEEICPENSLYNVCKSEPYEGNVNGGFVSRL